MIDFIAIRDSIVTQLNAYLNLKVIHTDQKQGKPSYPYLGYKFTSSYIAETGFPIENGADTASSDENFDYDFQYTRIEQPTIMLSLTVFSETIDEAEGIALNAMNWFKNVGYEYLKTNNIIVVDTTDIQNRDIVFVTDYERRQGFDVTLRVMSEVQRTIETIESYEFN